MEAVVVDGLGRRLLADAVVANHAVLVAAECRELVLAAQWADLHPADTLHPATGTVLPGTERARRFGGEGTPEAGEFAAAELGVLLGRSHHAAATLIADALDLRHRLPRLWAALQAGRVRVWQARHVAARTRATGLTLPQARQVDASTSGYLASLAWGRFTDLLEARIIAADPAAAEARRRAAELDRFVATGQSTEHGLKTLIAKATAGEIIYLVAVIDRIADILHTGGDTDPIGPRRAKALGILAHPEHALTLLTQHTHHHQTTTRWSRSPPRQPSSSVVEEPARRASRNHPSETRPPATLYVHISREAMLTGTGVARMEDVGPITIGQATEFLRHSRVTIRPVLDLTADQPVDAYEVPARLREQIHLRTPASAFPWSPSIGRGMDLDHTIPYTTPTPHPIPAGHRGRPGSATSANSPGSNTGSRPTRSAGDTDNPDPASTTGAPPPATSSSSTTRARIHSAPIRHPSRRTNAPSLCWSEAPRALSRCERPALATSTLAVGQVVPSSLAATWRRFPIRRASGGGGPSRRRT